MAHSMFNSFSLTILERLHGKKISAILGDASGTTERTWRNRLQSGWEPKPGDSKNIRDREISMISSQLREAGWPESEIDEIISRCPSWQAGIGLPTANLIYWNSPGYGKDYTDSIKLAKEFDLQCHALFDASKAEDIDAARRVVIEIANWLRIHCPPDTDYSDLEELERLIEKASTLQEILAVAGKLADEQIFLVMSCWDIEFCSGFTAGKAEAFPLFELVMPQLDSSIEVEPGTGRFLRDGRQPKQRIFQKSISRLFDFLAVLTWWHKNNHPPERIPSVKEMAAWFDEDEFRIVSWRDETTKFTLRNLFKIWKSATHPDKKGIYPAAPCPMLVAAHLWSPLLVRENGKPKQWFICFDSYKLWWKRNLDRLTAKGLEFGKTPWPKCLTYQPLGNRSPESWISSQSSGLSSHPLDSQ